MGYFIACGKRYSVSDTWHSGEVGSLNFVFLLR